MEEQQALALISRLVCGIWRLTGRGIFLCSRRLSEIVEVAHCRVPLPGSALLCSGS